MTCRNHTTLRIGRARCLLAALFATALALLALGIIVPASAQAAEVTEPIVIEDPTHAYQGDGWEWTSAGSSGTLTLDNANIHIPEGTASSAIVVPDGATIHLVGENTITLDAASTTELYYAGIEAEGDLAIVGEPASSLEIIANGSLSWGIGCAGDLTVGGVEVNISATTVAAGETEDLGSEGIVANGNVFINDGATVAAVGSEYGLRTEGGLNITEASLVKFGVENALFNSCSLHVQGETMIANVADEVILEGKYASLHGAATISNSTLTASIDDTRGTIEALNGLDIVDQAYVNVTSPGIVMDVTGCLFVQNSSLRSEASGGRAMAIRVNGDLAVDNGAVTALGGDGELTAGINVTPNLTAGCEDHRGILTLSGDPAITAEGTHYAIAFWAYEEAWESDPVVLDPTIGALEGGMLSYAENSFDGTDFVSVWTYATDKISLTNEYSIEGASQRVSIDMEDALVFVTNEGEPTTGLETVRAIAADGTVYEAVEWLDGSHTGYYRFPRALPDGTYTVEAIDGLRGVSETVTIGETVPQIVALELCPSLRFPDIDTTQWYHEGMDWAILNGVLQGDGTTGLMEPERSITRAQMATMLWNAAGNPTPQAGAAFADVNETDWFAQAVAWACAEELFEGYGDGQFGPDDTLTREQAAVVMMRWQQQRGEDVSMRVDLATYPDASAVSDWAHESMSWAVAAGVIEGVDREDGVVLAPQEECPRAQIATIMMRAIEEAPAGTVV